MRIGSFALAGLMSVVCAGCGSKDDTTGPKGVQFAYIVMEGVPADSVANVDALGDVHLAIRALDYKHVEVVPGTFQQQWSSSDPAIASVDANGDVFVNQNGSVTIIGKADQIADTLRLVIVQKAWKAQIQQDTIVAILKGAVGIDGSSFGDTARFSARRLDRNGYPAPTDSSATFSTSYDTLFTLVPMPAYKGDSGKLVGIKVGTGKVATTFLGHTDSTVVQVVSSFKTVTISVSPSGVTLTPMAVTIPAGSAVVFRNNETTPYQVVGSGWRVGPIAGTRREAQVFTSSGTYTYSVAGATGTITVP